MCRPRRPWRRKSILRFWEAKAINSKLPLPPPPQKNDVGKQMWKEGGERESPRVPAGGRALQGTWRGSAVPQPRGGAEDCGGSGLLPAGGARGTAGSRGEELAPSRPAFLLLDWREAGQGGGSSLALPLALPRCHHPAGTEACSMGRVGLLLGGCARTWKSVRMASSGMARRGRLANKVALVTASTDG